MGSLWTTSIFISFSNVNSYESDWFVAMNDYLAVITGEYNFEQVKVWLEKYVPIRDLNLVDGRRQHFCRCYFLP